MEEKTTGVTTKTGFWNEVYHLCQNCGSEVMRKRDNYCSICGRRLVWS